MDFSIKFDTVTSGRSIVYIEGPHILFQKHIVFLSLKINFALANSEDPGAIWVFTVFAKVPGMGFPF